MARTTKSRAKPRARRKGARSGTRLRIFAALVLLAALAAGVAWWKARNWRPDEARWPDQGALVGEADGPVDFSALKGLGAKLVYLEASHGAARQDSRFAANLAAARDAGLQVGAAHVFDPCEVADGQSANFVTVVPRDGALLPPAIIMHRLAEDCPKRISDGAVESELMTLVNQIGAHSGKAAILAPSAAFEAEYQVARRLERNLWLTRNWFEPHYAGRPWMLWTANQGYKTEAADAPLRWFVVQP